MSETRGDPPGVSKFPPTPAGATLVDPVGRGVWVAALGALALFLLWFAFRSWLVLTFPHEVEHVEGLVLDWTRQVSAGQLPYKPIEPFPWNFSVYTPAYLAASAVTLDLLPGAPWLGGRLLSLCAALGLGGLLVARGRALGEIRGASLAGLLAAGLWLASPYLFRWATYYRPDMFALFWSALGVTLVERAIERDRRRLIPVAALCFVLAFWSKQSFFAAPLAALLFLALRRRDWLPPLILTGGVAGALVAALLWGLAGSAIFDDLILANANPYSWSALWHFQRSFFLTVPVLVVLALLVASRRDGTDSLYLIYLPLAWLVTFSVGKAGAWENYFLESLWILCALVVRPLAGWLRPGRPALPLVPLLLLLQLALYLPGFERLTPVAELAWLGRLREENRVLREAIERFPEDAVIWSEQVGVLAEASRPIFLFMFGYTQFEKQDLWDPAPLVERMASGQDPLLIQRWDAVADPLGLDRWSRRVLDASERGYLLGERAGEWLVREPLPFPPPEDTHALDGSLTLVDWMIVESGGGGCEGGTPCPRGAAPLPVELVPGRALEVHLLWRSMERDAVPLSTSVQLFAPHGARVAQQDAPLRREGLGGPWPAGALVRDELLLEIPDALPPGAYSLLVSLYESESGNARGSLSLPSFKVTPPPPEGVLPHQVNVMFGNVIQLMSHEAPPSQVAAGSTLSLRMQWNAVEPVAESLTAFLHLIAPDGSLAAQSDFIPPYPPPLWSEGETVEVTYELDLPGGLSPGRYTLQVGWYDSTTVERLPPRSPSAINDAFPVGFIELEASPPRARQSLPCLNDSDHACDSEA